MKPWIDSKRSLLTMIDKLHDDRERLKPRPIPTISAKLPDGRLIEMTYNPMASRTAFAVWDGERLRDEPDIALSTGHRLVPYSAANNLVKNEVVLFPSRGEEYG